MFRFNADVLILTKGVRPAPLDSLLPSELPVHYCDTVAEFRDRFSGNIGLVLLPAHLPDEQLEQLVRETLMHSHAARVVFIATDGRHLLRCEVPHDTSFVLPDEADDLHTAIKHLYVRAYYDVMSERYYKVSLSVENLRHGDADDNGKESIDDLERQRKQLKSYLVAFQQFLTAEDLNELMRRDQRYNTLFKTSWKDVDPSSFGLPDACPSCNLDWATWHDSRLQNGYTQIGAKTWRCLNCGEILAENDPDNYRIG